MAIKERLKQRSFSSPYQEAMLGVMVCSDILVRSLEHVTEPFGITSAQYNVLRILHGIHPDGHPRREIIQRMIHVTPDVTRLIDRLEKLKLVQRGKSQHDKRLSLTFITDKGLSLLDTIQPHLDTLNAKLWSGLTEQEALDLAKLCDKLAEVA
ncbi:MAG: MarR family transcriptional regulator [Ignavibacteria bacterium]|nr:MarR family transcriptional regulator [Ignavibacteria bacterium]